MEQNGSLNHIFYDYQEIDFFAIILIISAALVMLFLVQKALPAIAERLPGRFRLAVLPLAPVFRLIILIAFIIGLVPLVIRPTFQNFVAIFGAAALALGFAFREYASDLIAGVVVIFEKPYRPGDWVTIDGVYGEVRSMGLRALRIVTPDDTVVTIPHSRIWSVPVCNANFRKREHLCVADFYLQPDHDAAAAAGRLLDVAMTSPYLQMKRPVSVVVAEKPWGTHYRLKAYPLDNRDEFPFISDLTVRGKAAFSEAGIRPSASPLAVQG